MPSTDRFTAPSAWGRYALISGGVALLHGAALWALQTGLVPTAAPTIVPAEVIAEFIAPPTPEVAPPPPAPPAPPTPKSPPTPRPAATKAPAPRPTPAPLAVANAAPDAPQVAAAAPAPDPAPVSAPAAAPTAAPATPAPPAPPRIELPSSNATHLNNPSPGYPAISKRLGEQGRVMLRVLIGADGLPQKVEVSQSSGYERLDRQAQEAVMRWRFVPGKRGGVPEAMWYAQPINFVLE